MQGLPALRSTVCRQSYRGKGSRCSLQAALELIQRIRQDALLRFFGDIIGVGHVHASIMPHNGGKFGGVCLTSEHAD